MARVNIGVDPKHLSDQHLIAESVEITMITGGLRKHGFEIKSPVPDIFKMGTGHINFFKNKLVYLKKRLGVVNDEMRRRNFWNQIRPKRIS
jgi:deoxyribonuclease (pyrimidine dimer)